MNRNEWCDEHFTTIQDLDSARFIAESKVMFATLETGDMDKFQRLKCWGCAISASRFASLIAESALIDEKRKAFGGTYTSQGLAVSGPPSDD